MTTKSMTTLALIAACGWLSGCADSGMLGSSVTTSSVDPNAAKLAAAPPKPDPACVALLAKIDAIRKDGVTERVEKAANGKSSTVPVKRASLAQMTELSKANADYQVKCSAPGLKPIAVAPVAVPVTPVAAAPAPQKPAKTAAVAKPAAPAVQAAAPAAVVAPTPAAAPVAPVAVAPVVAPAPPVVAASVAPPIQPAPAAPAPAVVSVPGVSVATSGTISGR